MTAATLPSSIRGPEPILLAQATRDRLRAAIEDGRLYPPRAYQARRLASTSRFNLDLWSRQTGKSYTNAQDAVHLATETAYGVMALSGSLDQTKELMLKIALYTEVIAGVAGEIQRAVQGGELDELFEIDPQGVRITSTIITVPGGNRIIGRPANPRTARGFSTHVKLDEFTTHREQDEIYTSAYGSITSNRSLRFDVMSTRGLRTDDKFSELIDATIRGETDFSFMEVSLLDAIAQGLDADAEEMRRNLRDDDRFRREFLNEKVDEAGALIPIELIRGCEHEGIRESLPADPRKWDAATLGWDPNGGELFLGVDIGRHHDLTVFWILQRVGDVLWTRAVLTLFKTPFSEQRALGDLLLSSLPIRRACVDASGLGMQLAEEWGHRFGSYQVEPVTFTGQVKAELAEPLHARFQDKLVRVPIAVEIRNDIHSIRKSVTPNGNVRYAADRTPDGHADRFWALALANAANKWEGPRLPAPLARKPVGW